MQIKIKISLKVFIFYGNNPAKFEIIQSFTTFELEETNYQDLRF